MSVCTRVWVLCGSPCLRTCMCMFIYLCDPVRMLVVDRAAPMREPGTILRQCHCRKRRAKVRVGLVLMSWLAFGQLGLGVRVVGFGVAHNAVVCVCMHVYMCVYVCIIFVHARKGRKCNRASATSRRLTAPFGPCKTRARSALIGVHGWGSCSR